LSAEAQGAKAEAQSGTSAARDKTPDFAFAPSGLRAFLTFELSSSVAAPFHRVDPVGTAGNAVVAATLANPIFPY